MANFKSNQEALCKVMLDHPGVICYHVDYPSEGISEWVEIYAEKGKSPLSAVIEACDKITCRCFGDPDAESRKILDGFGTTFHNTAPNAFALNPRSDTDSRV